MRVKIGIEIDKQCSSCNYCCISKCFKHKKLVSEEELCNDWSIDIDSLYENIEFLSPKYIGEINEKMSVLRKREYEAG